MMIIKECPFSEVRIFKFDGVSDNRGSKIRLYSAHEFAEYGIDFEPKEDVLYRIPRKNTLYGIHFQFEPHPQQKIIRLIEGSGIDYVIDLRKDSPTYKKWHSVELSAENQLNVFVPRGFGHLFRSTADNTLMIFSVDCDFDSGAQTVSFRDPEINLDIRTSDIPFIMSAKDSAAPFLH